MKFKTIQKKGDKEANKQRLKKTEKGPKHEVTKKDHKIAIKSRPKNVTETKKDVKKGVKKVTKKAIQKRIKKS